MRQSRGELGEMLRKDDIEDKEMLIMHLVQSSVEMLKGLTVHNDRQTLGFQSTMYTKD